MNLRRMIKNKVIILDGATGTNLLDKGGKAGESPSLLNLKNRQAVFELQKAYVDAGSDIILTNTFGADRNHFSSADLTIIISAAVKIANRTADGKALVWADVTSLGELIKPYGNLDFFEAFKLYYETIKIFIRYKIKTFFLETFTSIIEAKAAFLAAKEFTDDIFVSFSFENNGKTLMGEPPECVAAVFEALGAKGIGVNCTHPDIAIEILTRMAKICNLPLIAKPNAGSVEMIDGKVRHSISQEDLASYAVKFKEIGANFIGGCCGTNPEYIKMIASQYLYPIKKKKVEKWVIVSPKKILEMKKGSICIVGERINPSGRRKIKEALERKNYSIYAEEARLQEQYGAHALDVSAFSIDVNEKEALIDALYEIIKVSSLPLFIDTKDIEAAKLAMAIYPGIGIVNSIPAKRMELKKWLPLVKKFGFKAVISLLGNELPRTATERIKHFHEALKIAAELNYPIFDLIFDPLVISAATNREQIKETIEALRYICELSFFTVLGISNISFGLPDRQKINAAFIAAATYSGANFLIVNPLSEEVMSIIQTAGNLFRGKNVFPFADEGADAVSYESKNPEEQLKEALIIGDTKKSAELAERLIKLGIPHDEIIDNYITKTLHKVGEYYEQGKYFIPDLLLAAEAAKVALDALKPFLPQANKKGKIVIATVKGDIHDVGKNIVSAILQSVGYEVIDLGKDVPANKIIEAVKKYKPDVVGLSALLTTTMLEMESVIKLLRNENLNVKVIIGGPNVSLKYAEKIGAYGAARNIAEGLKLLD